VAGPKPARALCPRRVLEQFDVHSQRSVVRDWKRHSLATVGPYAATHEHMVDLWVGPAAG